MAAMHVEEFSSASEVELLQPEPRSRPRRWATVLPLLAAAAGAALMLTFVAGPRTERTAVAVRGAEIKQEESMGGDGEGEGDEKGAPGCSNPGDSCLESGCCVDGGENGYQCYHKTDGWAECKGWCEKGEVTDGETDGTYDQYGSFRPTNWSCKEVGKRSKKACTYFSKKSECDADRCVWGKSKGKDACLSICGQMPDEGACGSQKHCMWYGGECKPGCGSEATCPTDRCAEKEDKSCIKACWTYQTQDDCPLEEACIFEDPDRGCEPDPCSSPDESCLETKCCSQKRGGGGMTCFAKDENYAQCKRNCWEDGWGCDKLGNRTKLEPGCSWPGQDCRQTKLCCQDGFACAVKDELFTGCTQTKEKHTWDSKAIDIPSDWEGTVLGGSRSEYEVPAAGDDEEKMGDFLFCFMAYLPDSSEVGLMEEARELNASIFACDSYSVYESWQSGSAGWDTGESTITNTDVFLNVWQQVYDDGKWETADWIVKVDPDAVLVPERLKWHIAALNAPAYRPIYLKNNGMDPGLGNDGFLGAIEIFSNAAIEIYMDNWEGCKDAYGLDTGEDGFFKGCMDALGVGYMTDVNIFKPDFSPGACANKDMVGFHPLKEWSQWRCCWDIVLGKNRKVEFAKCDMGDDGKGPAEEPPAYVMPPGR